MSSDEYVVFNGVRYRRVDTQPVETGQTNPTELRTRGELLREAERFAPSGKSLISGLPQNLREHQPMNPYSTMCLSCSHPLVEANCPQHGSGGDYVGTPAGYYHRKCLADLLDERKRQMLTADDMSGLQQMRR